jgi:hypothetical protein
VQAFEVLDAGDDGHVGPPSDWSSSVTNSRSPAQRKLGIA